MAEEYGIELPVAAELGRIASASADSGKNPPAATAYLRGVADALRWVTTGELHPNLLPLIAAAQTKQVEAQQAFMEGRTEQ